MKITSTIGAYVSPHSSLTPDDMKKPESIARMAFISEATEKYYLDEGYTRIGSAEITVELLGRDELVAGKVSALREQAKTIRANATEKVTRIEGQINQLLAIENSAAPA